MLNVFKLLSDVFHSTNPRIKQPGSQKRHTIQKCESTKNKKTTNAQILDLSVGPGPRVPKQPQLRARPSPGGSLPMFWARTQASVGRAPIYWSLHSRTSCWRPPSYGLALSCGLALRAAFGRTRS